MDDCYNVDYYNLDYIKNRPAILSGALFRKLDNGVGQ